MGYKYMPNDKSLMQYGFLQVRAGVTCWVGGSACYPAGLNTQGHIFYYCASQCSTRRSCTPAAYKEAWLWKPLSSSCFERLGRLSDCCTAVLIHSVFVL